MVFKQAHSYGSRGILLLGMLLTGTSALAVAAPETGPQTPPLLTFAAKEVPATVHVNALPDSGAGDLSPDPLVARYDWDFGDPDGRFNTLTGWNAAHVYAHPGDYHITLKITDEKGARFTRSAAVHVASANRRRIYVSAAGDDSFDGTESQPVRNPARASFLAKSGNAEILLRRGDTFDVSKPWEIHACNVRIGAYGDGPALPRLRKIEDPAESIFLIFDGSADVTFDSLEFDSIWDLAGKFGDRKVPARGMTVGGSNITVRNCTFRNLSDAINTEWHPRGVLVQDCLFTNEIRSQPIWSQGTDHVYIGNGMKDSKREHLIRASEPGGVTRVLIAHNNLSRPNNSKGSIELRCASWFYVSANHIRGGSFRVGPQEQDKTLTPDWAAIKCRWGVVEDNVFDGFFVNIRLGTEHCLFRNNLVRYDGGMEGFLIECVKPGFDDVRKVVDIRLIGNTVASNARDGHFVRISGRSKGTVLEKNLLVAPNLKMVTAAGSAVQVQDADLTGLAAISGNVWPRPGPSGTVFSVGSAGKTPAQWAEYPQVRGDRYENAILLPDGSAPPELGAGAVLATTDEPGRQSK